MNFKRILAVTARESRAVLRDRLFFAMAFIVPPILLLTFGYGLSSVAYARLSPLWTMTARP